MSHTRASWIFILLLWACDSAEPSPRPALTRAELLDPNTCKDCHPKHYVEWSASMHAYASKDPVFLAMNKRGQEQTGGTLGEFCVNCHAPMAVRDKAISNFADVESVPEPLQGVTCYFCHNAVASEDDHFNAKIELANDTTMRAALFPAQIPSVHKVKFSDNHDPKNLKSSLMCGTCHDIVTPAGFHLERTLQEYRSTVFAEPELGFQSCQSCHMDKSDLTMLAAESSGFPGVSTGPRTTHEHLFPAVDVPLTPFPGGAALRLAVEKCKLPGSITYLTVTPQGPLGPVEIAFETQAGHAQPSGATQDRRMWVEVEAYDESGKLISAEGVVQDGELEESPDKPHPCMLRDRVLDAEGNETHMFWEAAKQGQSNLLPVPQSNAPGSHTYLCRFGRITGQPPALIKLRIRMRPIGRDVLEDLVESGHLDLEIMERMPTLTVLSREAHFDPATRQYLVDDTSEHDCDTYKCMLDPIGHGCEPGKPSLDAGAPPRAGAASPPSVDLPCVADLSDDCTPSVSPTFDSIYQNVLRPSCGALGSSGVCHDQVGSKGGLGLFDKATAYDALLGMAGRARVLPGNPSCSVLIERIESSDPLTRMPLNGSLDAGVRCAIRQWIQNGAAK